MLWEIGHSNTHTLIQYLVYHRDVTFSRRAIFSLYPHTPVHNTQVLIHCALTQHWTWTGTWASWVTVGQACTAGGLPFIYTSIYKLCLCNDENAAIQTSSWFGSRFSVSIITYSSMYLHDFSQINLQLSFTGSRSTVWLFDQPRNVMLTIAFLLAL